MFNRLVFQEMKKLWRNTAGGVERLCLAKSYVGRVRQRRIEIQVFGVLGLPDWKVIEDMTVHFKCSVC